MSLIMNFEKSDQLTKFGKTFRHLRILYDLPIESLSKKLNLSTSILLEIELGKREIPFDFFKKIKALKIFHKKELENLQYLIYSTIKKFTFEPRNEYERRLLSRLAESFDNMSEKEMSFVSLINYS